MDSFIPTTALSVVSLVNNLISSAKNAKELAKQSSDPALKEQTIDLLGAILDVKERVLELDEQNHALREQLAEKASITRTFSHGFYFRDGDPDPLCPKCYEDSSTPRHLSPLEKVSGGAMRRCLFCNEMYWEVPSGTNSFPKAQRYRS